jgi:hypothetical protein
MNKSLIGLAALPLMATVAFAAQPVSLNDKQMDNVTAGFDFYEVDVTNTGINYIGVDVPAVSGSITSSGTTVATAYLNVVNTWFGNSTVAAMQTVSFFGP